MIAEEREESRPGSPAAFYALFCVAGLATVLLGVLLPELGARGSLGDAHSGRLLASQFTGQLLGALLVGRAVRKALLGGLLISTIAAVCLVFLPALLQDLLFVYGLGLGLVMTATNMLVGLESSGSQRASRLETLNIFWPVGAAVCPWFAALFRWRAYPLLPYGGLAICFVLFLPLLPLRPRFGVARATIAAREQPAYARLIFCCLLALLAIGVESALAGWLTTFGARYLSEAGAVPWVPSLFWSGLLLGRLCASRVVLAVRPSLFGSLSALFAAAMVLLMALSHGAVLLCGSAFLAAFAVAPLYPVVLARSVDLRWQNLVFFSAGMGSAFVPWLVGRASLWSGSLREAMAVPGLAAILLTLVFLLEQRSGRAAAG